MSTRQLTFLLAPSVLFLMFSAGTLFFSIKDTQAFQNTIQRESTFQHFVDDVRSGRRQMTTGLWIDIVTGEHASAMSQSAFLQTNASALQGFGLFGLIIAVLHFWLVLSIRKDLKR